MCMLLPNSFFGLTCCMYTTRLMATHPSNLHFVGFGHVFGHVFSTKSQLTTLAVWGPSMDFPPTGRLRNQKRPGQMARAAPGHLSPQPSCVQSCVRVGLLGTNYKHMFVFQWQRWCFFWLIHLVDETSCMNLYDMLWWFTVHVRFMQNGWDSIFIWASIDSYKLATSAATTPKVVQNPSTLPPGLLLQSNIKSLVSVEIFVKKVYKTSSTTIGVWSSM